MKHTVTFLLFVTAVFGCAHIFQNPPHCVSRHNDGLCWTLAVPQVEMDKWTWTQLSHKTTGEICRFDKPYPDKMACVVRKDGETKTCHVASNISAEDARYTTRITGRNYTRTMLQHEIEDHCGISLIPGLTFLQWDHTEYNFLMNRL